MFDWVMKSAVAPLILRLALAAVFIIHGSEMVRPEHQWGATWYTHAAEARAKPGEPPEIMEPLRTAPAQMAVAWGEFIGGIALGVGFLTRLAALGLIAIMAGAIYFVHWTHGFDITKGGFEYNVVIIAVCLVLILTGGGTLAVDRFFRLRRKPVVQPK
jgi:putative oxidoreductase